MDIAPHRLAFPALLLGSTILALGPWLVRLSDVGPVAAGFWRLAIALPLIILLAWRSSSGARPSHLMLATLIVGGLFFAADLAAWHYGIVRTKLANATLFGNASSFLFPIYGFILLRALPTRLQSVALLLAAAGTAAMLGSSYELSARNFEGDLFAILAGLFYTFYLIAIDRARRSVGAMPVLAWVSAAGAPPLLLLAVLLGETVMPRDWTPLVFLSLGSQLAGQGLLIWAIGHVRPLVVGLVLLTQPIVASVIGWIVYAERLSAVELAGAVAICAALVLIRLPRRAPPRLHDGGGTAT